MSAPGNRWRGPHGSALRRVRELGLVVSLSILWLGCSPVKPPNLVLISLDTTRADRLFSYGYAKKNTPRLSRFAAQGVRFAKAYSATATTGPSHATLFTSQHPYTHGLLKNGMELSADRETLAEILANRGYITQGFAGSYALNSRFALDQGFASWDDDFEKSQSSYHRKRWSGGRVGKGFDRPADETTRRVVDWLEGRKAAEAPFFLFVHYFDPHDPYSPPERFRSPRADAGFRSLYDGEIAFVDEQIGVLLDALKRFTLAESSLVVIVGDHGEGLMQRGYKTHGIHLYEEAVHVPLLMRLPGVIPRRQVIQSPVGAVDIAPSILELLFGQSLKQGAFQGESLAASIREGGEPGLKRPIYLTRRQYNSPPDAGPKVKGEQHGVRVGRWKYLEAVEQGKKELYNLASDPGEKENLASQHPDKVAKLSAQLESWRSQQRPSVPVPDLDPEVREQLEVMGYVE